ncbi:hypothetical protein J5S49_01755 [Virgibacillus halodenitrificans]|uniref:hypothetical protein n=1 Tax=Virgibacillus halodenitrificans TaxID=1482 RepID=UPI001F429CAD|nr:hypothetical protein [Virgibacillus halodenitrificans]MCG1027014.1 hypothetical protein [Virgibacillus halodenitrificans]
MKQENRPHVSHISHFFILTDNIGMVVLLPKIANLKGEPIFFGSPILGVHKTVKDVKELS